MDIDDLDVMTENGGACWWWSDEDLREQEERLFEEAGPTQLLPYSTSGPGTLCFLLFYTVLEQLR